MPNLTFPIAGRATETPARITRPITHPINTNNGRGNSNQNAYKNAVLAAGPTDYWRLDETSGALAADIGSSPANATYTGSPTLGVTGLLTTSNNAAVSVNGTTQCVATPLVSYGSTISFTWMGLFKPADVTNPRTMISNGISNGGGFPACQLRFNASKIDVLRSGASLVLSSVQTVSANTIYHVTLVVDLSVSKSILYVNGALDNQAASTSSTYQISGKNTLIGATPASGSIAEYFSGVMDEVAFFTRALSASEVAAIAALR